MSFGCMTFLNAAMMFQTTIMNPMLNTLYGFDPELSSLFFTIGAVSFIFGTPIAFQLRKRKLFSRRMIIFCSQTCFGASMIMRSGNLTGNAIIHWVYTSQIISGVCFGMLTTTIFPEIVDAVEQTPMYKFYDKEACNIYISGLYV